MKFPLRKMKVSAMYIKGTKAPLNRTFDQVWQSCVRRPMAMGQTFMGHMLNPDLFTDTFANTMEL